MENREIAWLIVSTLSVLLVAIYFTGFGSNFGNAIFFGEESGVFSYTPTNKIYDADSIVIFRPDPVVEIDGLAISGSVSGVGNVKLSLVHDNVQYVIDEFQVNNEEISFGASCQATCDLSSVDMESDRYLIAIQVSDGAVLNLDSIIYATTPLSEALASLEVNDVLVGSLALSVSGVGDLNAQGASAIYCGDELIVNGSLASGYYCDGETKVFYNESGAKQISFGGQTIQSTIYEDVNALDVIVNFAGESEVRDVNGKKEVQVDVGNNRMVIEDVLNLADVEAVSVKIEDSQFATPLIAVNEELVFDRAIITLEKNGNVDTIFYCPNFDFETSTCPQWQETQLGFADNGDTISFEVNSFSAYAGGEGEGDFTFDSQDVTYTDLNSCGTISVPGAYRLINDVTSAGTCFTITADDVLFNGDDHTINYAQSSNGDGIRVASSDRVNIIDTRLSTTRTNPDPSGGVVLAGINVFDSNEGVIFNNTLTITGSYDNGVFLSNSSLVQVRNNTFQISGLASSAIELRKCKICVSGEDATPSLFNNVIAGNIIAAGDSSSGIESYSAKGTLIEFNRITLVGGTDEAVYLRYSSDTTFSNNNVESTGIALHVSQNNGSVISNNVLLSTSASVSNAIRLSPVDEILVESNIMSSASFAAFLNGAKHATFRNNEITSSSASAVYILGNSVSETNNTFEGNLLNGNSFDLQMGAWTKKALLKDQNVSTYAISSASGVFIEDSVFGNLFFDADSGFTGLDLYGTSNSDVSFLDNFVNISPAIELLEANVTLYNVLDRGFTAPAILRNGVVCANCVALTPLTAQDVMFTIPTWGEYVIGETPVVGEDVINPSVTLTAPADSAIVTLPTTTFEASFSDNVGLASGTLYVWNAANDFVFAIIPVSASGISASVSEQVSLSPGTYYWNFEAVDASGNRAFASANRTLTYELPYDFNLTRELPAENYSEHARFTKFDTRFNLSCTDDCGDLNVTLYYGNRTQVLSSVYNLNDVYLMFDPGVLAGAARRIYTTWDVSSVALDPAVERIEACYYGNTVSTTTVSLVNPAWSESSTLNEMKALAVGSSISAPFTEQGDGLGGSWFCFDITPVYNQYKASGYGLFSFALDNEAQELDPALADSLFNAEGLRMGPGTGSWLVERTGEFPISEPTYSVNTPHIKIIYAGIYPPTLQKIPTTPGAEPFFITNSSNPQGFTLNNEDINVTFNLNATAAVNSTWELVAIANDLIGTWKWSRSWFETIIAPKPVLNITKWLPLGSAHETAQNNEFLAQFNTSCSGDCEAVNVTLAYGSRKQVINDVLADVFIVSDTSNGEFALQRRTFETWDISQVDRNIPIVNMMYCSYALAYTDSIEGFVVDPAWDESSSVETIRSLSHSSAVLLSSNQTVVLNGLGDLTSLTCIDISPLYALYLQSGYSTFSFALDDPSWPVDLSTAYEVVDGSSPGWGNAGLHVSNWLYLEDSEGSIYGEANTPYIEINYEQIYPASVVDVLTLPAGAPFNTPTNPFEYGDFANEFAITNFDVNATGEIGTTWEMFAYANSSVEGVFAISESWFETIVPSVGELAIEFVDPLNPDLFYNVSQNEVFNASVNVTCLVSDCGNVDVSLAYKTRYVDPNGTIQGWNSCTGNECPVQEKVIDDHARTDRLDIPLDEQDISTTGSTGRFTFEHIGNAEVINGFTVWVYGISGGNGHATVTPIIGGSPLSTQEVISFGSPPAWRSAVYAGPWTPEEFNNLVLELYGEVISAGSPHIDAMYIEVDYVPGEHILIPDAYATPFYTGDSNPIQEEFFAGDEKTYTWLVNASGDIWQNREIYAFANITDEQSVNAETNSFNLTITKPDYFGNGPVVNLLHPANGSIVTDPLVWFLANVTDTPPALIDNGTLYIWDNATKALIHEDLVEYSSFAAFGFLVEGGFFANHTLPYEGVFEWNYQATNDYGVSAFNVTNFTVEYYIPDTTPPEYANLTRSPDPAVYAPLQDYEFNITVWDESGVGFVIFDFNGVNYSVSPNIGDVYTLNLNGLNAGTYTYKVWVNDTLGNGAVTPDQTYVIAKGTPSLNLAVSPGGIYPTSITALGTNCPAELTCSLYENGALISNPQSATLNVGDYDYEYSTLGNSNYEAASVTDSITITPGATSLNLFINGVEGDVTESYLTPTTIYTQGTNGDVVLTINSIDVTASENDTTLIRNAGEYVVVATLTPHANYAPAQSVSYTLTIDKAASSCTITSNTPVGYPATTLVSGSCDNPEAAYNLYRDDVEVNSENGVATLLPVGTYAYEVNTSETANYLGASAQTSVVVAIDETQYWPNLEIEIIDDVDPVNAGSVVVYMINVTNTGNETASGIELTNVIPTQGSIVGTSPIFVSPVSLGTLLAGESVYLNVSIQVDALTLGGITINDSVVVTYANDSGPTDASAIEFTLVNNDASSTELEVDLLSPSDGELKPEEPITFIYSVYGQGIHSCRLWSDETGSFAPTTTYATATAGLNSIENLDFADGDYIWNVECRSYAGYTYFAPYNYTFSVDSSITDTQGPVVQLIEPEDGAVKPEGQIVFVYSVEDNYDPQCRLWTDVSGSFVVTQDWMSVAEGENFFIENLNEGNYEWNVECVDASGNNAFADTNFNLIIDASITDDYAPIVDLLSPYDGEIKPAGEIDFIYRVEDDYDPQCSLWTNITGTFSETRPAVGVAEGVNGFTQVTIDQTGEYRWNVLCEDAAGNSAFAPEDFTLFIDASIVDNEAPVVDLVAPENGAIKPAGGLDFIYRVEDNYDPECRLWSDIGGEWGVSRSYEPVAEGLNGFANLVVSNSGTYTWNVECKDGSDNSAFARENWTVIVDASIVDDIPPYVELLAPLDGETKPEGNIDFIYRVEDNYDPECRLWTNQSGNWLVTRSYVPVPEGVNGFASVAMTHGEYIWNVECEDVAGNTNFAIGNFTLFIDQNIIDNEPPTVELLAPEDGAIKPAGGIDFIYSVDDNYDPQCRLWTNASGDFRVDRSYEPVAEGVNDFLNFFITQTGEYRWNVECRDGSGNSAFAPSDFTLFIDASIVDLEAPVVNLITPEHLSTVPAGFVNLTYEVQDNYDPECRLYFNSTGDFIVERSFEGVVEGVNTWLNIPVSDGSYLWNVECEDVALNRANATSNYIFNVGVVIPESNDVLVSEGIFEPLCCADGTTGESATCDASNDVSCDSGLALAGSHNNEFIITVQNVTSPGGVHSCEIMQSNGAILSLSGSHGAVTNGEVFLNYVVANQSNAIIDRTIPWRVTSCVVNGIDLTLNSAQPIYVHRNTWSLFNLDVDDASRALDCYASLPFKYFNNTVKCTVEGDINYAISKAKGFTLQDGLLCHDGIDNYGSGLDCADSDCLGMQYFTCPDASGYATNHPFLSGYDQIGSGFGFITGNAILDYSIPAYCNADTNICSGVLNLGSKNVPYKYTLSGTPDGTLKVMFLHGSVSTSQFMADYITNTAPPFSAVGKYARTGGVALPDDETSIGVYKTSFAGGSTFSGVVDQVMYLTLDNAPQTSYLLQILSNFEGAQDTEEVNKLFISDDEAPSNWDENDAALPHDITYIYGTITSNNACNDDEDNDLDFTTDCRDTQCVGVQIGETSNGDSISCEAVEDSCWDGFDNDGDGLVDCADLDCNGKIGAYMDGNDPQKYFISNAEVAYCEYGTSAEGTQFYGESVSSCSDNFNNDADAGNQWNDFSCDGTYADCRGSQIDCFDAYSCWARSGSDAGICPQFESSCTDGIDNDYDVDLQGTSNNWKNIYVPNPNFDASGADCDDYDCSAVVDGSGNVVCSASPSEVTEWDGVNNETCFDGIDNDLDAYLWDGSNYVLNSAGGFDCNDSQCLFVTNPNDPSDQCLPKEFSLGEYNLCYDTIDNDYDGRASCVDNLGEGVANNLGELERTDCWAGFQGCGPCPSVEDYQYDSCADAIDNDLDDGNGAYAPGAAGLDCSDVDCSGELATYSGSMCGAENTPEQCSDGKDNDGNGQIDAQDAGCSGVIVGGTLQVSESSCSDGFDNDQDGLLDCADTSCYGVGSCIDPALDWSKGSYCGVVPQYTTASIASSNPTIDYTHQRREYAGEDYSLQFSGSSNYDSVTFFIGSCNGNEFSYDLNSCSLVGSDAVSFELLEDPSCNAARIRSVGSVSDFNVGLSCAGKVTPQDASYDLAVSAERSGDLEYGEKTPLTTWHETLGPNVLGIQVGGIVGTNGGSISLAYGSSLGMIAQPENDPSGICSCVITVNGDAHTTANTCTYVEPALSVEGNYDIDARARDGSANIGPVYDIDVAVELTPIETTASHKLNRAFYRDNLTSLNTGIFSFATAQGDTFGDCRYTIEDATGSTLHSVDDSSNGNNRVDCQTTFDLPSSVVDTDGIYFVKASVTDSDGDSVLSKGKVLYVCNDLTSSGITSSGLAWTCAKADLDNDGETEGTYTTLYNSLGVEYENLACDTCPGITNLDQDLNGNGIDDACDDAFTGTACVPDWSCSDWGSCSGGEETRSCVDLNGCGDSSNIPDETQSCSSCTEEWACGDWSVCSAGIQQRTCSEISSCGTTNDMPSELQSCGSSVTNYARSSGNGNALCIEGIYARGANRTLAPGDLVLEEGREILIEPFAVDCSISDVTVSVPLGYTDYLVHRCNGEKCDVVTATQVDELLCNTELGIYRNNTRFTNEFIPNYAALNVPLSTIRANEIVTTPGVDVEGKGSGSVTIQPVQGSLLEPLNPTLALAGVPLLVQVEGNAQETLLSLKYTSNSRVDEATIQVYLWKEGEWQYVGGELNTEENFVQVKVRHFSDSLENGVATLALIGNYCGDCTNTLTQIYNNGNVALVLINGPGSSPGAYQALVNDITATNQPLDIYLYDAHGGVDRASRELVSALSGIAYDSAILVGGSTSGLIAEQAVKSAHEQELDIGVSEVILVGVAQSEVRRENIKEIIGAIVNTETFANIFIDGTITIGRVDQVPGVSYRHIVEGSNADSVTEEIIENKDGVIGPNLLGESCVDYFEVSSVKETLLEEKYTRDIILSVAAEQVDEANALGNQNYVRAIINDCSEGDYLLVSGIESESSQCLAGEVGRVSVINILFAVLLGISILFFIYFAGKEVITLIDERRPKGKARIRKIEKDIKSVNSKIKKI